MNTPPEELDALPPRHYPEWDLATQSYRPDWTSVYEALHPAGNPADIDRLLEKHAVLARQLKRLLDLLKPQDRVRIRYQEEGSELDLDVAVRALIDLKSGTTPDTRINLSHRTDGRDISVLILLDLSQSLNDPVAGRDHPDHAVARAHMRGFGGVVSFLVRGDEARTSRFIDRCQLPQIGPSLGGVESLIEQPALMSFYELSSEQRLAVGIRDNLVRLSVGVEDPEDLLADLTRALADL